jgi:hypothetical protein
VEEIDFPLTLPFPAGKGISSKSVVVATGDGMKINFNPGTSGLNRSGEGKAVTIGSASIIFVFLCVNLPVPSLSRDGTSGLPAGRLCVLCVNVFIFPAVSQALGRPGTHSQINH